MSEPASKMLNPLLALIKLYQKDNKTFNDVITDITGRLNEFGMGLDEPYIKEKVLPWVLSFMFMTTGQQMLEEYIQGLQKPTNRTTRPSGFPHPPPADMA